MVAARFPRADGDADGGGIQPDGRWPQAGCESIRVMAKGLLNGVEAAGSVTFDIDGHVTETQLLEQRRDARAQFRLDETRQILGSALDSCHVAVSTYPYLPEVVREQEILASFHATELGDIDRSPVRDPRG